MKGVARSKVLAAALDAYLSPESEDHREAVIARRFQRLGRQLDHLKQGQTPLIETLAFFIHHYLASAEPAFAPHQEAIRARGRARLAQFIERLVLYLQADGSFVTGLEREFAPADCERSRVGALPSACFNERANQP